MPPAMALTIITVRLFIRKPMYTRQITGRKPMQVSRFATVSYTHLDVYKRQVEGRMSRKMPSPR